MSMVERYRRWFAYEQESHRSVLASLRAVPASGRGASYQRALDLFGHLIAARRLWLHRFGRGEDATPELFPRSVTLEEVEAGLQAVEVGWGRYLESLDDDEVARAFDYRSYEGDRYRNVVEDILTQLFGHSWYHRGQIASLVRQCGGEPAVTDFVYWTREPLAEEER